MRILIIANPIAGRGAARPVAERVAAERRARGDAVDLHFTERYGHAAEIAADSAPCDRLVVIGGDGTMREIIAGLGARCAKTSLVFLPFGHGNVVAREFDVPLDDPVAAARAIDSSAERALDVGTANTKPFLAMVGVGFDSFPTRFVRLARSTRFGRWLYSLGFGGDLLYGLGGLPALLRLRPQRFEVFVDGSRIDGRFPTVTVCNTRIYATGWSLAPDARPDDGMLDVVAQRFAFLPMQLLALLYAKLQRPMPRFLAARARGRSVEIRDANERFHWQLDGDAMGLTDRLEIGFAGGQARVRIVAPPPED